MATDTNLLQSLSAYIKDVKPFHSKLQDMTTELQFNDTFTAAYTEKTTLEVYLQNVWTKNDLGGTSLYNFSGGTDADRTYVIPAAVFPRFSLNDSLNVGQLPHGTDPATVNMADASGDGIPDSEQPWSGIQGYSSHQLGSHTVGVDAGIVTMYRRLKNVTRGSTLSSVVFGYDILVTINDIATTFGYTDAVPTFSINGMPFTGTVQVTSRTSYILVDAHILLPISPFAVDPSDTNYYDIVQDQLNSTAGINVQSIASYANWLTPNPAISAVFFKTGRYHIPFHCGSRVRVNGELMVFGVEYVVDHSRGFIQFMPGRFPQPTDTIDINYFTADKLFFKYAAPFNGNTDSTQVRDYWTITRDNSATGFTVVFNNTDGVAGKAIMKNVTMNARLPIGTVIKVSAASPVYFYVQQTATTVGPITFAYFDVAYTDNNVSFTIDPNWTPYYLTQDTNSYNTFTLNLAFFQGVTAPIDPSDYLADLSITTQRGQIIQQYDPFALQHAGMRFEAYGTVLLSTVVTPSGPQLMYNFVFDVIPPLETYIEFRVEQAGQYNQIANTTFTERLELKQLIRLVDCMCAGAMTVHGEYYTTQADLSLAPATVAEPSAMWYYEPRAQLTAVGGVIPPRLTTIYKMALFEPNCFDNSNTVYEQYPYDMSRYETDFCAGIGIDQAGVNFFTYINDEFYCAMTEAGVTTMIHHVHLHHDANFYEEPQLVNQLIMHYSGAFKVGSIVVVNGNQVITPTSTVIEDHRIIINFATARSFAVWIEPNTTPNSVG